MLEILLCSLVTIVPDYLYRRYVQGQADRQGDHPLLRVVRAAVGDHRLPDSRRGPDHGDLLQPSVHDQRHVVLQDDPDRSRDDRTRRRGLCRLQRPGRQGRADLQARQLEAGGGGGNRAPQDRRGRCGAGGGADRYPEGGRPDPGGQERSPAGLGRTGDQAGAATAQSGQRRAARNRAASGPCRRPPGCDRRRHGRKAGRRGAGLDRSSGRRRPAPKPRWPRPRWNWRRRWSAPA